MSAITITITITIKITITITIVFMEGVSAMSANVLYHLDDI